MSMKIVKPATAPEKRTSTTMDTVELTQKIVASWKSPPFQRDLKVNSRVMAVAEEILANGGVVPGILTIGVLDSETYVVDGQHRLAAWMQTALPVGYADVRTHWFDTMGDMANEFVRLNSSLVKLRPDDILRGLEPSTPLLRRIRRACPFVGYDMVRRGDKSPVLSMSVFVRVWEGTRSEVPQSHSSIAALGAMTEEEASNAIDFFGLCHDAWKRDFEYRRLWGALNLMLCAWLYRRTVLAERVGPQSRIMRFTKEEFRKCLYGPFGRSAILRLPGWQEHRRARSRAGLRQGEGHLPEPLPVGHGTNNQAPAAGVVARVRGALKNRERPQVLAK